MVKSAFSIAAVAAVAGLALAPAAASAATVGPAALAFSSSPAQVGPGVPAPTIVTFAVTSTGTLSLTAPGSADLGTGAVGSTITGSLGPVSVTDDRALDVASWTVTAASSDWTTGAASLTETIPASDVAYTVGPITTTGTISTLGTDILALSGTATPVVAGTAGVGDNGATWTPTISVAVPAGAVAGGYSGTITQSVA